MIYKLYTCCKPVKGYNRSIIQDLNRTKVHFVPNDLYNILVENKEAISVEKLNDLKSQNNGLDYINFMVDNEIIFEIDEIFLSCFPEIQENHSIPFIIDYLILDIQLVLNDTKFINQVFDLSVNNFVINCEIITLEILIKINTILDTSDGNNFFINTKSISSNELTEINRHILKSDCLLGLFVNDLDKVFDKFEAIHIVNNNKFNMWYNNNISFYSCATKLNPNTFKKVFIDDKYVVRNSIKSSKTYVLNKDIKNSIYSILEEIEEQPYYSVSKDDIDVCKDCEFRYLCNDDRIPVMRSNKSWYHLSECPYNPYISKWEGEEGYVSLYECGVILNENRYSRNDEIITAINEEIWAE
jgi:hypothetical protein